MQKEYWLLALKNLKHRGIRTWLTLLGIFIGVMAVVSLIGLGNALQSAIYSQFGAVSTEIITIQAGGITAGPPGTGVTNPLTVSDLDVISNIRNIEYAIRRNIVPVSIEYNRNLIFGYATNVPQQLDGSITYEAIDIDVVRGRLLDNRDRGKVVVGYNYFSGKNEFKREVDVRDRITINDRRFEVVGVLERQGSFILDNILILMDDDLKAISNYGDNIDIIALKIRNTDELETTVEEIKRVLRRQRGVRKGEEDFEVSTPETTLKTVNDILLGVRIFVLIIALISVFVGAIGIANTMTTSVVERKKEIGIMKSIGATNYQIFIQFFIEAGLLGFIGGLIGAIFGTAISFLGVYGINNFVGTQLTPKIDFILVLLTLFGSFIVGAISGIIPAINAAKLNPVESLRK